MGFERSRRNERSRCTFGIDADTAEHLAAHHRPQLEERLLAGSNCDGQDLDLATRTGNRVPPGNFDQTLDRLVGKAGVPRLTSHHGLRPTAATHMVHQATDLGELRAVADVLGTPPTC